MNFLYSKNRFSVSGKIVIILCTLLVGFFTSNNVNAATKTWVGAGAGGAGTDFNAPANWSPATALSSTDDLVITCSVNNTFIVALSANANVNSVTLNYTATTTTSAKSFTIAVGTFTLSTVAGYTVANGQNASSTFGSSLVTTIASGGTLTVGGNLAVQCSNTSNFQELAIMNCSGALNVTGTTTGTSLNTGTASQVQFLVGNSPAKMTCTGAVTLGTSTVTGNAVFLAGNAAGTTTGTVVFKSNLTFAALAQTTTAQNIGNYLFDGTGTQTITINSANVAFSTVVVGGTVSGNSPTVTLAGTSSPSLTALATSADLTVNNNALLNLNVSTLNRSASGGTLTLNNTAGLAVAGSTGGQTGSNFPLNFATMTLSSTSTVFYFGGTGVSQTIFNGVTYGNLNLQNGTLSGTSTKTAGGNLTTAGYLGINDAFTAFAASSFTHNIGGDWLNNGTFTGGTSTINFNGANAATISGTATTAFKTVTINKGSSVATILNLTGTATIATALTVTTGLLRIQTGGTLTYNGSNISVISTAGIQVNAGTLTVNGATINNDGLFRLTTGTANIGSASGNALDNSATAIVDVQGGTLNVAARLRLNGSAMTVSGGTINLCTVGLSNANRTPLEMDGASDFTMTSGTPLITFQNANTGTGGDLKIASGGAGTKSITAGSIQFGNASTPAATTFVCSSGIPLYNVTINNTNTPKVTLAAALTVNNQLAMNGGALTLGAFNMFLGISAPAISTTGSFSASNMIVADGTGGVVKMVSANGSYIFPIGDNTGTAEYSPITIAYSGSSYTGSAFVATSVVNAKHPNNNSTTNFLNRYWLVTQTGITGSPSVDISATYVPADISGTESAIKAAQLKGTFVQLSNGWIKYATLGSVSANKLTANGAALVSAQIDAFTGITGADPTVTSTNGTVCSTGNTTTTLTATPGAGNDATPAPLYSWSPAGGTNATTTPIGAGAYTVTLRDANGIVATATGTITATTAPVATAGTNVSTCANAGPVNITAGSSASNNAGIIWTSSGTGTFANANSLTLATYDPSPADISAGSVIITLTATGNSPCANATSTKTLTILPVYTISASAGANGTISPAGSTTLCSGTNQTYTITAAACYHVADVLVDGSSVGAVGTYTFSNVTANHTIAASFAINTYTATVNAGANGTITPGSATVNCGSNNTYTITPDACYHITDVTLNGVSQGAVGTLNVNNVQANYTVAATFAINTYTATVNAGANGTITPGSATVNCGSNNTYTITANACYHIVDVTLNGVSQGAVGTLNVNNVQANYTVAATFAINTYTATINAGANGTITPASATVNCGSNNTYTITANACYHIVDVTLNGVSQGAGGTLNVNNVQANYTVAATFAINTYTATINAGANGTITPGSGTVNCGSNNTYTITANACYHIVDVTLNGVSQGAVGTLNVNNVQANYTVAATFAINTFTITATSGANGTVTPAGATTVNCGANQAYTITPDACYSIADVLVDGVSVGAVGTYTFTNVTANHTISATFVINGPYTITASSGANGTVTPAGTSTVACGSNNTYTITPDACYSIADVLVDGSSVGAVGTYTFTNVTANHTISATFAITTYTATINAGANGSITPGSATVNCGSNNTYTITPDACYHITDVTLNGVSQGAVSTLNVNNVQANYTVAATFAINTYTATVNAGANGTITPGSATVNCGSNNTYTITANACYHIVDVTLNGVSQGAVSTLNVNNVQANYTVAATFAINTYTITATSGANGTVTPAGATTVNCGANQAYTITPAACYSIADVLVDGVSVGAVGTYTFNNVTTNHTISATFSLNTYTITATSGANGTVTPAGATTVNCGANQSYTITPDACYSIADVLVDGVSVGAVGTYTFTNVTASHTISATFSLNTYTITATSGANGTVTPAGATTVNCGANQAYTITPDACYSIADVLVDGVSVGAVGTYTFTNVTASHTISATFSLNTYTITATSGANGTVTPAGATTVNCGANQTYTITPDACYSIADVLVDGVSVGAVGTYTFTNVTASHTISATFSLNTYTITATSGANGTVTPAGATTVNCGANQTYTITPDACYSIADVLVDGVSVGAVGTYTFTNVTASHTISATFSLNTFTITATSGANGTVTPAGATTVNCGANQTYTITPDACYSIADVLVDGVSVGAVGTYTFTNVTASHTISATFSLNTYTITATSGANGTVTPAGATTVNCGANQTYTITPDACYSIADVLVDGVSVGAVGTYTFTNVTASHTISATFSLNTYTITATSGANGTVTPAGATTVNCGANQTYTITPDACYSIADVLVDGVSVGAVGTYTFTNVTASHTISATFSLNTFTITATSGANGTVTPAGATTVNCGANQAYTITPDACYSIADVLVDGVSVGAVGTYTFTNVTASHTISATFSLNTYTITATSGANGTVTPAGATTVNCGANQTYTITPDACYSIADVLVDGVSVGAVATYTFTNVTASHTISATFSLNTYTITATSGANGTVTPAGATTVNCGANQAYTITPDACYSIADVLVDGVSVGAVGTYTFTNVTASHTISATFSLNTYTITATSGANGTVTPAGATTVNCGANQAYTITPAACYSIADVLVDGVSVGAVGTYTFTNVTASHTISATFSLNTYTITATSGANGTVTPAGATTVNCGANQTYTITPDACYSIADVLVDGVSVGAVGTYTFTNVTASHTISATFSLNTFTITATSGANGTVTPAGATTVNCGANQTYTITPDACYSIADVLVDGVSVGAVGTYTFTNVTASHTISATFSLNTYTITATSGANGTVTPAGATTVNCGANQAYTITPDACYSIADVLVDGVSVGAVATYTFTNVTASHTISATFSLNTYTITATSGANGTVTPAGATTVNCGANQAYTITPDACYSIADILVDGVSVGAVGTYTFTNVTASHTISATFSLNTYTITATSGANGTVTPAGATTVNCGANQAYTITPDACYSIADVLVDDVSVGAVGTYTFTNVTASHTISATFSLNTYTITATSGANGTVTPAGATTVNCGANQTYTITPDACYSIADVLVDGVSVGAVGTYTFTNVTASHTISATFSLNTYTITATSGANGTVTPAGATTVNCGANQTYTITPAACYSIADVLVDGVSVGAVGTYTFTNVTASHTISATFSLNTYTITATSGTNGTVTPAGATTVNCGANQTYTITPDACYSIADVLVDGVSVGAVGTYTFTNVTASHTISATFSLNTYTITATSGANGTVTPAGATTVNCGTNQTYTITPDACYSIADVLVDGVSVGAVGTYTFTNVTANHTISATFSLNTYTITATSGANGTVTPAGATTVNCGANQAYTITPDACYSIADVLVDGVSVGAVGTYTFTNVTTNHTISATFSLNTFTITATSGANGTVTPAGATTVNCGANQTYTITPAACYSIADVLVDGVSVGAVGTYTFNNVTTNHTISATFSLNTYTITATSGANGTVTPAGATTVNCGANQAYTITPDACYSIADVLVDGVSVGAVGTYTFTNVTTNHTISATFSLNTFTITATSGANGTVTPAGATTVNCGANQTYTITPDACYSIADVLVDGVSVGAVGTYTFTNVTASHTISATFSLNTYTITATSGANGTVTPSGATTVNCGANQTYTITPNACYSIADVLVDGVSVGAVGTYTFTNVTASHTISATFSLNTFTITATSGANGTVTPAGATTVNCGANQAYTITPDACYSIADVLVDGVSVGAVGTYTFTNVTASHTISATFSLNTFTITATSGANGTVTPAGATTVNCGANQTYTVTPAACYSIADVLVDGVSVGAVGTYTFTNVTASHTISATFSLNTFTITATSGANGTVTPAGATTVNCGANQAYTITPAACYSIANVLVDGVSVGAVGAYTFTNVTASHTISASFVAATYTINASAGAGGTITPSGAATVACGGNATYTIAANNCYSITNVVVDGISQGAVSTYTFTNVTANHTISATFTQNTYIITVSAGTGGTVTPGTGAVNCGSNATYTITAAACNHIVDVLVDGVSQGAVSTYTFTNVTAAHTISATFTGNAAPATPTVTGPVNVCTYIGTGAQVTYTATSAGATGFTWVIPPTNVAIVTGQGTANLTVTFQNGFAAQGNKQLRVTATSACGNSSQTLYVLVAQTPGTPGPITGNTNVCPIIGTAATYTYTINSVLAASSYIWTVPSGATIVSHPAGTGANDTVITVSFSGSFVNNTSITVASANNCNPGGSAVRSLAISRPAPATPGLISGPGDACPYMAPNGTPATYSIAAVAGAVSYTWTVPGGVTITGQGTTSISFTYASNFTSGSVTVTATNGCGTSAARSLGVSKYQPAAPSNIDVILVSDCPNRVYTYSIATTPLNSTSVQWTIPSGGTIVSGQGTTSITVSYAGTSISGNVTVQAVNNCSASTIRTVVVRLPACAGGRSATYAYTKGTLNTSTPMEVKVFPNPSVSDFKLEVLTAGKETIYVRILDMEGREYRKLTVLPYQTATLGSDLKPGSYMIEVKQGEVVKATRLIKF